MQRAGMALRTAMRVLAASHDAVRASRHGHTAIDNQASDVDLSGSLSQCAQSAYGCQYLVEEMVLEALG